MHPMEEYYLREVKKLIDIIEANKKSAKFFQASSKESANVIAARKEAEAVLKALNKLICVTKDGQLTVKSKRKGQKNQKDEMYAIPYGEIEFLELTQLAEICSRVSLAYRFVIEGGKAFPSELFVRMDAESGEIKKKTYDASMHESNRNVLSAIPDKLPKWLYKSDLSKPLFLLSAAVSLFGLVLVVPAGVIPALFIPAFIFFGLGHVAFFTGMVLDARHKGQKYTPLYNSLKHIQMKVEKHAPKSDLQEPKNETGGMEMV